MSKEISYSDGEIENEILQTLKESSNVSAAATIAIEKQTSWAFEYHLSCQRANLVRHFNFQGKRVLEIGAGMGAVSRYVAEKCEFLQIVEGTSRRLSCLQERLRDLRNFNVFCGNFKDFKVEEKFDVILIIGVLEYADLYFEDDGEDPFVAFLKKAKSHLKPEGEVLLAIENRLGLKYWAGATEDHTGAFFDGILGYRNAKTVRTFSKKEIRTVLESAGFLEVNFQYPFPDYKLPRSILTEELANRCPDVFASIAGASLARDYGRDRVVLFSESVGFNGLIDTGLLTEFSNSFLIISRQNKILKKDKVLGYSYSQNELKKTMTHFEEINDSLMVNKRLMDSDADEVDYQTIRWIRPQATEVKRGALLIDRFKRSLTFREWEIFFEEWKKYVSWIFLENEVEGAFLKGEAWDLVPQNIIVGQDGKYAIIKPEWFYKESFRKSWFILRCILQFDQNIHTILCEKFGSLKEFYFFSCGLLEVSGDLALDVSIELKTQDEKFGMGRGPMKTPLEEYLAWNLASGGSAFTRDSRFILAAISTERESSLQLRKSLAELSEKYSQLVNLKLVRLGLCLLRITKKVFS